MKARIWVERFGMMVNAIPSRYGRRFFH